MTTDPLPITDRSSAETAPDVPTASIVDDIEQATPTGRPARYDRRRRLDPTVSVIVPTYNEAGNIPLLVPRLRAALEDFDYEVIIVDDDSPDLTWKITDELVADEPRFSVVRRTTDKGLSAAVLTGMNVAQGSVFVVMDGDLQHDPEAIPALISKVLDDGADIAVASRAADGGSYGEFGYRRRLISWVGARMAHVLLRAPVTDPMSGFFALRRHRYEEVVHQVNPRGFKILLEFLARGRRPEVAEVGYRFGSRVHGNTKLTGSVVVAYLLALIELSIGRFISATFTAYCLVGFTGLAVRVLTEQTLIGGLPSALIPAHWAVLVAVELSVVTNYLLNNVFTFTTRRHRGFRQIRGLLMFHLVSLYGLLVHAGATALLRDDSAAAPLGLTDLWTADFSMPFGVGITMALIGNYHLNATVTWRRRRR
ncbi:MAG: glycosyltransferase family 2 protein [Acidimicrobiia bacterium]|nr:glycosyltransferase family 2 protein [Acidimicrobiia bacterium]MDH5519396.1 glycosyltransferase family 2 protein [Acidimicrobiia bacterium]